MEEKIKCKICGKVGFLKDKKGLQRHLRLVHNICVSKQFDNNEYFESADSDSVIDIKGMLKKDFRRNQKKKWHKLMKCYNNRKSHSNQYVRIIYTPMSNG